MTDRNRFYVGQAPLFVETFYRENNSYLAGVLHTSKGWHWHFSTPLPYLYKGKPHDMSNVVQGPFSTEAEALEDAAEHMAGRYHLPVHMGDTE